MRPSPDRFSAVPATRATSLSTGWQALDEGLGGGWPVDALAEVCGRGRSTLALAAVRCAQAAGQPVAWLDGGQAFCPATAGVDLARLTLVRPGVVCPGVVCPDAARSGRALLAADLLLRSRAFGLLVLDWPAGRGTLSVWFRLARQAQRSATCLLLLTPGSDARAGPITGSAAALTVRVALRHAPCASWEPPPPPALDVTVLRRRGSNAEQRLLLHPADARTGARTGARTDVRARAS